jgi:hypothetical protein
MTHSIKSHAPSCCRTHTMTLCHVVWNACVEIDGSAVRMCRHFPPHFHTAILDCLSITMVCGGNDFGDYSSQTENVTLLLYVGKKFIKWKLFKILVSKHRSGKKFIVSWNFHTSQVGKSFSVRKCIKRAMYMLPVWESFATKLFGLLQHNNYLSRDVLSGFHHTM